MAVEAGCKSGIVPADEITEEYVAPRAKREYKIVKADSDATYKSVIEYDVSKMSRLLRVLICHQT